MYVAQLLERRESLLPQRALKRMITTCNTLINSSVIESSQEKSTYLTPTCFMSVVLQIVQSVRWYVLAIV